MSDYIDRTSIIEAVEECQTMTGEAKFVARVLIYAEPSADVVKGSDFRDCRNELCDRCGRYTEKHLGACDGCRWESERWQ